MAKLESKPKVSDWRGAFNHFAKLILRIKSLKKKKKKNKKNQETQTLVQIQFPDSVSSVKLDLKISGHLIYSVKILTIVITFYHEIHFSSQKWLRQEIHITIIYSVPTMCWVVKCFMWLMCFRHRVRFIMGVIDEEIN